MIKKKIVHIIDELKLGGAQTHLITMLRELKRRDEYIHEVAVLLSGDDLAPIIEELGVKVVNLNLADAVRSQNVIKVLGEIRAYLKESNPDIVEAHLTWSRLLVLPVASFLRIPKRIGFEQGDVYFKSLPWRVLNFIGQFFAHHIVVCSQALKDWVRNTHHVSSGKLTVLYNCVDPISFQQTEKSPLNRTALGVKDDDFICCSVGTLGKGVNKRVDISIKAVAQAQKNTNRRIVLLICGDGAQKGELQQLARDLNMEGQVQFLGSRSDVPDILSLSDTFIHAAVWEPFGIVCIEAMLLKRPVIIPNSGGTKEIVTHEQSGLIYEALNVEAYASSLLRIIQDPELCEKLSINGYEEVMKRFTVKPHIDKVLGLYES